MMKRIGKHHHGNPNEPCPGSNRCPELIEAVAIVRSATPNHPALKDFESAVARVNEAVASIGNMPRKPPKRAGVRCMDCGEYGVSTGHMECRYPGSRVPS